MKFEINVDLSGAYEKLDDMEERVEAGLRYATFQGVEILRNEMIVQAPRHHKRHYFYSKGSRNADGSRRRYEFEPGDLRRSIFAFYDKSISIDGAVAMYQVGWRHSEGVKAGYSGKILQSVPYGYMVHNGTKMAKNKGIKTAANPFVHRAVAVAIARAEKTIIDTVKDVASGKINRRRG